MALFSAPLVDFDNPLYCPEVSAHQYMSSIRLFQASVADASKFPYFHRMCTALMDNMCDDSPECLPLQLVCEQDLSKSPAPGDADAADVKQERDNDHATVTATNLKRESDEHSSDLSNVLSKRPSKRIKRSSSLLDMSYVLSAKADRLRFSDKLAQSPSSDVKTGQYHFTIEECFWPEEQLDNAETGCIESSYESGLGQAKHAAAEYLHGVGLETPKSISALLERLEKVLPGMRLQGQLDSTTATHQDVVNLLGIKGHLNPQTLSLFRDTHIQSLNLTESMANANGLNLMRNDTLKLLRDPATFLSLRTIVLSDVPLSDDDLICLNNLSYLETLFLDDTQIGDVAVMHLIGVRQSLIHLELSWNDRITDDAIPTLCNLSNLDFLSLKGTGITMKGLRRLACSAREKNKKFSIILPTECEEYVCNQHNEYEHNVKQPLIHDPDTCQALSESALRANLAMHATHNSEINTDGTRTELEKRLRKLLKRRKMDMLVHGFMLQGFA